MDKSIILELVKPYYSEPHRKYHTMSHIEAMLDYLPKNINDELFLACVFHDIVYVSGSKTNEEDSCDFVRSFAKKNDLKANISTICDLIMATKKHDITKAQGDTKRLIEADLAVFSNSKALFTYEDSIFYEHQQFRLDTYRQKRVEFLESFKEKFGNSIESKNIDSIIHYIQTKTYTIAYYAGSFNPYHIGHENIANQAESIADKVIIAQGINREKSNPQKLTHRFREVLPYLGLITGLFDEEAQVKKVLVRGLRNSFDVGLEDNLRNTIYDIKKISIVYFFCDKKFEHISSSMIRSLYDFGKEVYGKYLVE